ncbi:MAG: TonB-dependent receptor [Flavobacteriaceae bacterium]|nr:TonB-dependent receptor [Flavobacteriaceae bacterium]
MSYINRNKSPLRIKYCTGFLIVLLHQINFSFANEFFYPHGIHPSVQQELTGTVTDQAGTPLIGVNIIIKDTKTGTQTDFDGNYTLRVTRGDVLVFSYIGYVAQETTVGDSDVIDIVLQEDSAELEQVVIVGFGSKTKKSVVGSISTVTPKELKIPASNLTTALAGRLSGVISFQRSGEPGADNANFFVRGITTLSVAASPLILIDGVELTTNDLARLHPDDIETFSILKDATETAIYGARGANGIILVTTKMGQIGKPRISVRYETSLNSNTQLPQFADPITYMKLNNEAVRTRTPENPVPYSQERIIATQEGINNNVFPSTDWQDVLLEDYGLSHRVNFNVNGGGEVAQYYVAGGFVSDAGNLKEIKTVSNESNVSLNRFFLRSNVSVNLSDTTKATIRLQSSIDELQGPAVPGNGSPGANVFARTLLTSPVRFPAIYEPDEDNVENPDILFGNQIANDNPFVGNRFGGSQGYYINPFAEVVSGFSRQNNSSTLIQVELEQDLKGITPGLSLRFLGNSNQTAFFSNFRTSIPFWFYASEFNYDRINNIHELTPLNPQGGSRSLGFAAGNRLVYSTVYGELTLNYSRTFKEKHSLSGVLVGIGRQSTDGNATNLETSLQRRNLGISGRFTYGLYDKYFFEFSFGYNGSERFHPSKRFGFFPSFGAAWVVSDEKFFGNLNQTINNFKLRFSYGEVGNDSLGNDTDRFFYLSSVNLVDGGRGYFIGRGNSGAFTPGVSISRYADPNINWEVAKKTNYGIDVDLFNNAIQIKADYFTERRENILQNRLIPLSLGLQAVNRANIGIVEAQGFDGSVDVNHYFKNEFWVSGRVNFTYANGKVVQFEEPNYSDVGAPNRSRIGTKINQRIGFIGERLFVDDEDVRNSPRQFGNVLAGDIKYKDMDENGIINDLDRVPIGKPSTPQVTYGFGFSLGYKSFDISAFFQGIAETSLYIDPTATSPFNTVFVDPSQFTSVDSSVEFSPAIGETPLLKAYSESYWSEDNRDLYAVLPRLGRGATQNNQQLSNWWLRDGSFLRLKQMELGYTVEPKNQKSFVGLKSLRIYLTGTNLVHWSTFKLWDPEVGGNGFGYPLQRTFNIGLLTNF